MAGFNFTALAAKDLRDIGRYTKQKWAVNKRGDIAKSSSSSSRSSL